ncbi:MAG: peptide-methionine (S)-S-oxide reductase [Verrucomicrobiota bacterium]
MKSLLSRSMTLALLFAGLSTTFAQKMNTSDPKTNATQLATFGGGCFWCIEAVFERLDGVKSVTSGYAGGQAPNPTYEQVCSGKSGHAEVAQIEFDSRKITYEQLLDTFWAAHDPTMLNRQGADRGTQYRSVIFYHDDAQKIAAAKSLKSAQAHYPSPIVTEISPLTKFYKAENYHQDYFRNNTRAPYCQAVIQPKLDALDKKKPLAPKP